MEDILSGEFRQYRVIFSEQDTDGIYIPGTQFEFGDWLDGGERSEWTALVAEWAVSNFEQTLNSRSDVVSYAEMASN